MPESYVPHTQNSQQWVNANVPTDWKPTPSSNWPPLSQRSAPIWTPYSPPGINSGFSNDGYGIQCDMGGHGFTPVAVTHPPDLGLDQSTKYVCLWSGCPHSFASTVELVTHVNLAHVPLTVPPLSAPPSALSTPSPDISALDCQWGDCRSSLAWTNDDQLQWTSDSEFEALTRHFMREHLGLPPEVSHVHTTDCEHERKVTPQPSLLSTQPVYRPTPTPSTLNSPLSPTTMTSPSTQAASDASTLSGSKHSACRWKGCQEIFKSPESLTMHLADVHVGSGHSSYECHWADCDRQENKSFSSKQKVLRHLQAHTGYRPFKCEQCGQFFSEAATLQQHVRRHTNESGR